MIYIILSKSGIPENIITYSNNINNQKELLQIIKEIK